MFEDIKCKFQSKFKKGDKVVAVKKLKYATFTVNKGEVGTIVYVDFITNSFDVDFGAKGIITNIAAKELDLYEDDDAYKCNTCTYVFHCTNPEECVMKRMNEMK